MAYLLFIEIFGIFIPLLFHSVYGILISAEAKPNVLGYGYARNWFYVFQRATGIFLFVFLMFHILNFRFGLIPGLNMTPVAGNAAARHVREGPSCRLETRPYPTRGASPGI